MTNERAQIEYPISQWPDDKLAGLFAATTLWLEHAEALATTVAKLCHLEACRRDHNRRNPSDIKLPSDGFGIDFGDWSDHDVGDGLLLASVFSFEAKNAMFGELLDELCRALVMVAAHRLRISSDPRNSATFGARTHDAEAN